MAGRILIVDDYPNAAEIFARLLSRLGGEVKTAHDGQEALATAQAFLPDLMLLDLDLPKLSGIEVAQKIREQPWGRSIIVIGVTGWLTGWDRGRTKVPGFDAILAKPVNYAQLKEMMARLLPRTDH